MAESDWNGLDWIAGTIREPYWESTAESDWNGLRIVGTIRGSLGLLGTIGLIGLEWPAYRRDHPRIIGLTGNHRLNRIGMASTLQGPSER